jgi:hypothetical protein
MREMKETRRQRFISSSTQCERATDDSERRGGSSARGGGRRLVGPRKAIGPRGWWVGMVETMENRSGPKERIKWVVENLFEFILKNLSLKSKVLNILKLNLIWGQIGIIQRNFLKTFQIWNFLKISLIIQIQTKTFKMIQKKISK